MTIVGRAGPLDDTPRRLYRITLANYFAAAVDDALPGLSQRGRSLELRRARAGAALQCRFRAGLSSPHHAAAAERARRAVLHAARRQCRQRLQALLLRHVSVLEIRRHLSAVERAFDLRHAGPPAQAGDRAARRHALFLDRADGAPAGGAAPAAAAALCHRPWAAKSATPRTWSTPPAWIWRKPRARRSASTAGSASAKTAASAPSRRSRGR